MQVLLNKDVKTLGFRGDIVDVAPGYFRNFLYPQGIAVYASKNLISLAESRKAKRAMRVEEVKANAKEVFESVNGKTLKTQAKVNDKGVLFAAISVSDLLDLVKDQLKMDLDASFVEMDVVKELGEHEVKLSFGEGMEGALTLVVEEE